MNLYEESTFAAADARWLLPRTEWGDGPWRGEPDRVEWRDRATGLPCLIVRGASGALCGYVGVPPGHPWHGVDFVFTDGPPESGPDVHGGVTFAGPCQEGGHICHVPRPGEPADVWWLGFDCAHAGDVCPALEAAIETLLGFPRFRLRRETYKARAYVEAEVRRLAAQAKARSAA